MADTATPSTAVATDEEAEPIELGADGLPLVPRRRGAAVAVPAAEEARRWPRITSTRGRLVASYLVLLVIAGALATLALRELLVVRLEDRVRDDLRQEIEEFEQLEVGINPDTGERFQELAPLYLTFFRRNVPGDDEALIGFVGRELYDQDLAHFPLTRLPDDVLAEWRTFSTRAAPGEQLSGTFSTSRGDARFLAVQAQAGDERGAFVVAILPVTELTEIRELQFYAAVIAALVVLVAAGAAWFLAGRVLAPVIELTETARSISESDLTRRIRVRGTDEAANMARTFNAMLDRLEAVYRSQVEFLRAAGHELRTPLTVATGHLETLGEDEDERRETMRIVLDELNRMTRIVEDLHELAEAEHPDFLNLRAIDMRSLAHDLFTKVSTLGERDWRLEETVEGRFVGDRDRIAQAVLNLADNAVKHTKPGDTIALGFGGRGDELHIWVRDTGVGIAPAEQERVFERFVRGRTAGQRYRGAGLGLAIVKSVAEAHGGSVTVDSEPGAGSQFTIVLPWRGR